MYLTIENKFKIETFVAIFQLLKNWSSFINLYFKQDMLYIQLLDKSHVCLANIEIKNSWFTKYNCLIDFKISIDATQFAILINFALKHNTIELKYDENITSDKLFINFLNDNSGKSIDRYFEINLVDFDSDILDIPAVDYDVDFIIESKKIIELLSELNTFGNILNIKCSEQTINLNSSGDSTNLNIKIPVDDLNEYAISEGEEFENTYDISILCKICLSSKLSSTISIALSKTYPMSLTYNLGDESKMVFYIAPKV